MKSKSIASLIVLTALVTVLRAGQKSETPEALLGAAIHQEEAEGDLDAAIAGYKKFLTQYGNNRPLAAKAQYRLGVAYQKLGMSAARDAFERVVRDFSDQPDVVADARRQLAAIASVGPSKTLAARMVFGAGENGEVDGDATITPDGRWMALSVWSTGDIGIRDMSTGQVKRLMAKIGSWTESVEYGESPALSPDARQVAYAWFVPSDRRYQLRLISNQAGARPRILIQNPEFDYFEPFGWSHDGKSIAVTLWKPDRTGQIAWVAAGNGAVTVLRSVDWRLRSRPHLSFDGKYIVYSARETNDSTNTGIHVLASDGTNETMIENDTSINEEPFWTPDGNHIIFTSNRSGTFGLWERPVRDGKPSGPPSLIMANIGRIVAVGLANSDSLYYVQSHGGEDIYVADIDSKSGRTKGPSVRLIDSFIGSNRNPVYSPDGSYVAFHRQRCNNCNSSNSVVYDLVVRPISGNQERTFTTPAEIRSNSMPMWFRDGRTILQAAQDQQGRLSFYRADLKTGEFAEIVKTDLSNFQTLGLSEDEKNAFVSVRRAATDRIVSIDLSSGEVRERFSFDVAGSNAIALALSPNRLRLAIKRVVSGGSKVEGRLSVSDMDGKNFHDIYTLPETSWQEGSSQVSWGPDGSSIFFVLQNQAEGWRLMRIGAEGGTPEFTGLMGKGMHNMSFSPDGSRLVFGDGVRSVAEMWALDNVLAVLKAAR